jgi:hypothetical protein
MSDCILGPDESGVFLTQILYDYLVKIQFEKAADLKLLMNYGQIKVQSDNPFRNLNAQWNQLLNTSPLIDIIIYKSKYYSHLDAIIKFIGMMNSHYILMNTAICIITKLQTKDFEKNLFLEMHKLIQNLNPELIEWNEKLEDLHMNYSKNSSKFNMKEIQKKNTTQIRKDLKQVLDIAKTNNAELEEECQMIVRNVFDKLVLHEKPISFLTEKNIAMTKNQLKKKILSLTYLDENQLEKLSRVQTTCGVLNKNLDIMFRLINYRKKFILEDDRWKNWLLTEYAYQTGYRMDTEKLRRLKEKKNKILELSKKEQEDSDSKRMDHLQLLFEHHKTENSIDIGNTNVNQIKYSRYKNDWIYADQAKELISKFLEMKDQI